MATTETDINGLSSREASRLVNRLEKYTVLHSRIVRDVLCDLPPADVDAIKGVLRITKERVKADDRGQRRRIV
jgi:hypothetical protein